MDFRYQKGVDVMSIAVKILIALVGFEIMMLIYFSFVKRANPKKYNEMLDKPSLLSTLFVITGVCIMITPCLAYMILVMKLFG